MTSFDDIAKRRIRYLTRRRLLELDIPLKRFMAEEFNRLNDVELATFAELLNLPDQDFSPKSTANYLPPQAKPMPCRKESGQPQAQKE